MYNVERAPKNVSKSRENRSSFRLPQHIHKLVTKLLKSENKENVDKTLKMFSNLMKHDQILREIFILFNWSEESKSFLSKVDYEDFMIKLEAEYEFNRKELEEEASEPAEQIEPCKPQTVHQSSLQNPNIINFNSNLSLFNLNKNDSSDMFFVQKPIPLSNSQGDRNLLMQETHLDLFLTNSAKVGWNHNTQAAEEDSSLISNWHKSSSNKQINKTPSFQYDEGANAGISVTDKIEDTQSNNKNFLSNNAASLFNHINKGSNNSGNIHSGSSFKNYKDYLSHIKPSKEGEEKNAYLNQNNCNNNLQTNYYQQNFRPYQSMLFSNPIPYNLYNGNIPFNQTSKNNQNVNPHFTVSNFKIDDVTESNSSESFDQQFIKKKKRRIKKQNVVKVVKNSKNSKISKISKILTNKKSKIKKIRKIKKGKKILSNKKKSTYSRAETLPSRSSNFGLKEISKKVKEIVRKFKRTTYKHISDLIVDEINEKDTKDEKNIRRRIYDSLNVMKAMNLFKKDPANKFILWNGNKGKFDSSIQDNNSIDYSESVDSSGDNTDNKNLNFSFRKQQRTKNMIKSNIKSFDSEDADLSELKNITATKKNEISKKYLTANLLNEQYNLFNDLMKRNFEEKDKIKEEDKIKFPFIIIEFPENKNSNNNINILSNENKSKLHFSLENPVNIYGDLDALKKLNSKLGLNKEEQTEQ